MNKLQKKLLWWYEQYKRYWKYKEERYKLAGDELL